MVNRISTVDGAARGGTTSRTVSSLVVTSASCWLFAVTVALAVGGVTVSVTKIIRGEFDAALALMTTLPLYVPGLRPDGFADTVTVTLACGLFDDADRGENDSQFASDDRVNDMSVCGRAFHTSTVCAGGMAPPCMAVNASRSVETSACGRTTSGVAVGTGVAVGAGSVPPPLPPLPPLPPPTGVCVGIGVFVDVAVGVGVGVFVGVAVGVGVGSGGGG